MNYQISIMTLIHKIFLIERQIFLFEVLALFQNNAIVIYLFTNFISSAMYSI